MVTDRLKGQFLKDDSPKTKKSVKRCPVIFGDAISDFRKGTYGGHVLPKRGAL